jgi:uncharacterized protein YciI
METHQILFYDYVEDIADRRAPYRQEHLERIRAREDIVMAGALGDPPYGAAIVFRNVAREDIEEFVSGDPYVRARLVTAWRVDLWRLV